MELHCYQYRCDHFADCMHAVMGCCLEPDPNEQTVEPEQCCAALGFPLFVQRQQTRYRRPGC